MAGLFVAGLGKPLATLRPWIGVVAICAVVAQLLLGGIAAAGLAAGATGFPICSATHNAGGAGSPSGAPDHALSCCIACAHAAAGAIEPPTFSIAVRWDAGMRLVPAATAEQDAARLLTPRLAQGPPLRSA